MEKEIRPSDGTSFSKEAREDKVRELAPKIATELNMNQSQAEGFIEHITTDPFGVYDTESLITFDSMKTAAEGWMQMRGWRAMYGGNDVDPR